MTFLSIFCLRKMNFLMKLLQSIKNYLRLSRKIKMRILMNNTQTLIFTLQYMKSKNLYSKSPLNSMLQSKIVTFMSILGKYKNKSKHLILFLRFITQNTPNTNVIQFYSQYCALLKQQLVRNLTNEDVKETNE